MSIRLDKPWSDLTESEIAALAAQLGVYQIGDADGRVVKIGYAGGRTLFGLQSALTDELTERGEGWKFRAEVNQQYLSRYDELLMVHKADHGDVPEDNRGGDRRVGRLSPG